MRIAVLCLTAVLGAIGCGDGTPQTVTTFEVDSLGRRIPGTEKDVITIDRQALLSSGVAATWNPADDPGIYGGETIVYEGFNGSGRGRGWGAGGNVILAISAPEWYWPGSSDPINDIFTHVTKIHDSAGTHHGDACFYQNDAGGGGIANRHPFPTLACWSGLSPGTALQNNLVSTTRSFYMRRFCMASEAGGPC